MFAHVLFPGFSTVPLHSPTLTALAVINYRVNQSASFSDRELSSTVSTIVPPLCPTLHLLYGDDITSKNSVVRAHGRPIHRANIPDKIKYNYSPPVSDFANLYPILYPILQPIDRPICSTLDRKCYRDCLCSRDSTNSRDLGRKLLRDRGAPIKDLNNRSTSERNETLTFYIPDITSSLGNTLGSQYFITHWRRADRVL